MRDHTSVFLTAKRKQREKRRKSRPQPDNEMPQTHTHTHVTAECLSASLNLLHNATKQHLPPALPTFPVGRGSEKKKKKRHTDCNFTTCWAAVNRFFTAGERPPKPRVQRKVYTTRHDTTGGLPAVDDAVGARWGGVRGPVAWKEAER